ncbi:MAG TPA: hypothetical protein VEA41_07155 [Salinarimonas sp.]|nr:hypothetical protein [Salinarimonas sp.]
MEQLLGANRAQAFDNGKHDFKAGQDVTPVSGPFERFAATILQAPECKRITVLLEMFGKKQELVLPREHLRAAC